MFKKENPVVIDVAFPVVHGTNVEDGTLQGYLHALGIPYAGCDVFSSAVCMDKEASKLIMKAKGIPVLDCKCYTARQYDENEEAIIEDIPSELNLFNGNTDKPVNVNYALAAMPKEKLYVDKSREDLERERQERIERAKRELLKRKKK